MKSIGSIVRTLIPGFVFEDATEEAPAGAARGTANAPQVRTGEAEAPRGDGSTFPVSTALVRIDAAGQALKFLLVSDLSSRRAQEGRLHKFERAIEQSADLVVMTNRDGFIEYVNPAFERHTGYTAEQALGRRPNILKSGQHTREYYHRLWQTICKGEVFRDVVVNRASATASCSTRRRRSARSAGATLASSTPSRRRRTSPTGSGRRLSSRGSPTSTRSRVCPTGRSSRTVWTRRSRIAGPHTSPEVVEKMTKLIADLGLLPVVVKKDVPGFVENRVLYAIMRECVSLVAKGVISPAELDTCVKWGIGFKLAVIGPMELLDVAGLDIYEAVASYLNADLDDSARVSDYITFSAPARSRCRAIVVRAFQSGWDWSARPCCV